MATPFEELSLEIGAESVAQDGDTEVVSDVAELMDLLSDEELGFVDQQTVERVSSENIFDNRDQVVSG